MKTTIKPLLILALVTLLGSNSNIAQNVGIGNESFTPDPSAMLEVKATDKGMLIPRVDIEDLSTTAPVTNPAVSLLVYNTNETTGEGFYYWSGTEWAPIGGISSGGGAGERYLGEEYLGGIIYYLYLDENGVQRGLIVSKTEIKDIWGNSDETTGAYSLWDGASNTNLMTDSPGKTWVIDLGDGWYLPSIDELKYLYNNRFHVNKMLNAAGATLLNNISYWSSTEWEGMETRAFFLYFTSGLINNDAKSWSYHIRAIRAF